MAGTDKAPPGVNNAAEREIVDEQVRQVHRLAPYGVAATIINAVVVFFVIQDVAPRAALVWWLAAVIATTGIRVVILLEFKAVSAGVFDSRRWRRTFIGGLIVIGFVWGSVGLLPLAGTSMAHQVFLAFVLGGMAAGAASAYSVLKEGYAAFSLPALAPLAVHFLLMQDVFHLAMGAMLLLYGILLGNIARQHYKANRLSLQLRFEKRSMIDDLQSAKTRLESMYASVLIEVKAKQDAERRLREQQEELERTVQARTTELRRSELLYRTIAGNMPDAAVMLIDRQNRFLVAEGKLLTRIGLKQRAEGHTVQEALPEPTSRRVEEGFRRALEGTSSSSEQEFDGRTVWSHYVPLEDEEGRIQTALNLAIDITERKRAEAALQESEERYRRFFELGTIGMEQAEPATGRLLQVNDRYCDITGYTRAELLARTVRELTHPDDRERDWDSYSRMLRGETAEYNAEKRCLRKDGRVIWVQAAARPIRDAAGKARQTVGVVLDITGRKQAEQEKERLITELERSNRELQQFAYAASHDLQEPLRTVSSFMELLARKYRGKLDEKAQQYISFAVEGSARMSTLISDLLSYSRVATRGHPFKPVPLDEVMDDVKGNLDSAIRETGAIVTNDELPIIAGDRSQLVQLLQNLIANGIKFRKPDVAPRIHVSADRREREWVFGVQDNGIGIDPRYAERIFVIFQRLHTREEYPGTGMGLAISKRIVERHGGRMWVDSRPGRGATFCFTLPALPDPRAMLPK